MAKVKITGHQSGSGVLTITAPNTSTDRTITLPDATATIATTTDVAARLPSITDGGNATAITINATENVGIEVTPESWEDNYPALQIGGQGSLGGHSGSEVYVNENVYRNGGNWKHINTAAASQYTGTGGQHKFKIAPSASADANIAWTTAMTINNSGAVTMPSQPAFDAHSSSNAYSSGTTVTSINLNTARLNVGSHYSTSNYRFTAPVAGIYRFNYRTMINGASNNAHCRMLKNGSTMSGSDHHYSQPTGASWNSWTLSILVSLAANDYVQVLHTSSESIYGNNYQSFNGYLLG